MSWWLPLSAEAEVAVAMGEVEGEDVIDRLREQTVQVNYMWYLRMLFAFARPRPADFKDVFHQIKHTVSCSSLVIMMAS